MKKIWYIALLLLTACLTGCSNNDEDALRADLEALKERIAALEATTSDLNTNIRAIRELTREGMTITEVASKDGVYTLTLSDGTTLRLIEKTEHTGTVPLVGIDPNGNWQVSYDNGTSYQPLTGPDGQPIKARGDDGQTPAFRVNTEGFWQVSYDSGANYQPVLDEQGNPVKAITDSSSDTAFFTSVTPTDNSLDIVLKDGTQLSIPIAKNFFCYFDARYTGVQRVESGQSATFDVHIKGTDNVLITAPAGWTATLAAADPATDITTLTVTAPTTTLSTRATADNSKDITLLATSGTFAQIAKIQVTNKPYIGSITASTIITQLANNAALNEDLPTDFWFSYAEAGNTFAVEQQGGEYVLKATVGATKGVWNKSAFGFHGTATLPNGRYKLTFMAKSDIASGVGITIRDAANTAGYRMIHATTGDNLFRNLTTPGTNATDWIMIETHFDFGYASTAMTTNKDAYTAAESAVTGDIVHFNIILYNNMANTNLYIKNITLAPL